MNNYTSEIAQHCNVVEDGKLWEPEKSLKWVCHLLGQNTIVKAQVPRLSYKQLVRERVGVDIVKLCDSHPFNKDWYTTVAIFRSNKEKYSEPSGDNWDIRLKGERDLETDLWDIPPSGEVKCFFTD